LILKIKKLNFAATGPNIFRHYLSPSPSIAFLLLEANIFRPFDNMTKYHLLYCLKAIFFKKKSTCPSRLELYLAGSCFCHLHLKQGGYAKHKVACNFKFSTKSKCESFIDDYFYWLLHMLSFIKTIIN